MKSNCSPAGSSSSPTTESTGSSNSPSLLDSLEITLPGFSDESLRGTESTASNSSVIDDYSNAVSFASLEQLRRAHGRDFKECYDCHLRLPIECFAAVCPKPFVRSYRNKRCNTCRARRQAGSEMTREKRALVESAKAKPCADCGQTFPSLAMEFDYVRGERKYNLGSAWRWATKRALEEEIAKCDVVCSCCFRIRHLNEPWKGRRRGRKPAFLAICQPAATRHGDKPAQRQSEPE